MGKMRAVQVPGPKQPFELVEKAAEAYELMMSGKARFRVVLQTGL